LVVPVSGRHDDQQIDIAVGVGRSVGVRPKQYDPLRPKLVSHLSREPPDCR
jgi:hypothetical protein